MRKLILVMVIGFGTWKWYQGELPFLTPAGAFDEAGDPAVWVFTIRECGDPCQVARNQLKWRRVSFEEKLIDTSDDADENVQLWKKFRKGNGFPLIVSGSEIMVGAGSKPQMATLLALSHGEEHLSSTEKRYFKNHFYPDGSPKIVMYGTDWCPGCKKLRAEFSSNDVDYFEVDIEKSGEQDKMAKTMEIFGYPATWVGYQRVNGVTLKSINAVLNSY